MSNKAAMSNARMIFGGLLVTILLSIYAYTVLIAVQVVKWGAAREIFTGEMQSTLSLIGGLVSALVIAELAVTRPGETPEVACSGLASPTAPSVSLW